MPTSPSKPNIACHRDVIVKGNLGMAAWAHRSWAYQRNGSGKAVNTHIQKTAHRHTKQEDEKLKNQGLPLNTFEMHWLRLSCLAKRSSNLKRLGSRPETDLWLSAFSPGPDRVFCHRHCPTSVAPGLALSLQLMPNRLDRLNRPNRLLQKRNITNT